MDHTLVLFIYHSFNFCSDPWFLPLPSNLYFNGLVMMREYSVWHWVPPPMRFGWFLRSCLLFYCVMSCNREGPPLPTIEVTLVTYVQCQILCLADGFSQGTALHPWLTWTIVGKFRQGGLPHLGCFVIHSASMGLSWAKGLNCSRNGPTLFGPPTMKVVDPL